MCTAQDDENSDIGTPYLGMPKMRRQDELKIEHKELITEDWYIPSKLLDGPDGKILLDTGASFMSKTFLFELSIITFFTYICTKDKEYSMKINK